MKKMRSLRILPVVGALVLAACEDTQPTQPLLEEPAFAHLTVEDRVALDVLSDDETIETALALAEVAVIAAERTGIERPARDAATDHAGNARRRFQAAQQALRDGNRGRAVDESREARRLIIQAVGRVGGARAVASMVERAEDIAFSVTMEEDAYADGGFVADDVTRLAQSARESLDRGDSASAGDRAILVEQRHRHKYHRPDARPDRPGAARIAVALGATAVALSERILGARAAEPAQLRFLAAAKEFQSKAERALAAGNPARVEHFAGLANWGALKAVVLPGGVTEREARAMVQLARTLHAQAAATSPTGLKAELLARARALVEKGIAMVEAGNNRGVAPLWRGAVISRWVAG